MKCRKIEKFILRSFDNRLNREEKDMLTFHLKNCPKCQTLYHEYQELLISLRSSTDDFPEFKPYFWERLQPRLKEQKQYDPWQLWKTWGLRAIPLSILMIILLVSASLFILPPPSEDLSDSGILLRDQNPFQESLPLLAEEVENPNMMLIFTALEEKNGARRYSP